MRSTIKEVDEMNEIISEIGLIELSSSSKNLHSSSQNKKQKKKMKEEKKRLDALYVKLSRVNSNSSSSSSFHHNHNQSSSRTTRSKVRIYQPPLKKHVTFNHHPQTSKARLLGEMNTIKDS